MVWVKCREYRLHMQHDVLYAYRLHKEHHVAYAVGKYELMLPVAILCATMLNKIDNKPYICNVYLVL